MDTNEIGILSRINSDAEFNEVFAKVRFREDVVTDIDDFSNFGLSGYPLIFSKEARTYVGLRCKSENGWFLSGCAYANNMGVTSIVSNGDYDSIVIKNSCVAGHSEMSGEDFLGGVSVSCMKFGNA